MNVMLNSSGGGMLLAPPAPTCPGPEEPRESILERCARGLIFMQANDKMGARANGHATKKKDSTERRGCRAAFTTNTIGLKPVPSVPLFLALGKIRT